MTPFGSEGEVHVTKRFRGEPTTRDTTGCSGADGTSNKNKQASKQNTKYKMCFYQVRVTVTHLNTLEFIYLVHGF